MKRIGAPFVLVLLCAAATAQEMTPGADDKCDGPVYQQGEVSRKAVITKKPDPGFTEAAREKDVSGVVSLAVVLCHTGRVTDVRVLRGLPEGLTEQAVNAARRVTFMPAEKDGRRVSTHAGFEYSFNTIGDPLEAPDARHNNRLVEELSIDGNRRLTDSEIIRHIKTRQGDLFSVEQVERDLQALHNLSSLDSTQTRALIDEGRRGGVVVIFRVVERPVVRDLTFSGLEGVGEQEVFRAWRERGVRVCKECTFDPSQMAAARAVVCRLLEERGQTDVTVEAYVSEVSSLSVALDFVITNGRRFD